MMRLRSTGGTGNVLANALRLLYAMLLVLPALPALAAGPDGAAPRLLVLADTRPVEPLGRYLDFFAAPGDACDIACARARFARGDFRRSDSDTPNFGLTGSYWFRLTVRNDTARQDWLADISVPFLDRIDLHVLHADGRTGLLRTGDHLPMSQRPLHERNLVLPLSLPTGEPVTLLFNVENGGPVVLPLGLKTAETLAAETAEENLAFGLYFGIVLAVLLHNLLIFIALRERSHLYYVLYAATSIVTLANVYGYSILYLWPEHVWWANYSVPFMIAVTGLFVLLFAREFMELRANDPRNRLLQAGAAVLGTMIVLSLVLPFPVAVRLVYLITLPCAVGLFLLGLEQLLRGNRAARFFMLGWAVLLVALILLLLRNFALIPANFVTNYGLLIGSGLEAVLLSIALADRYHQLREESARLLAESRRELAARVEERTRDLDRALRARSEFLATVSHEIRTPMNGVLGITELLVDSGLNPRQQEYAQVIRNSGNTLLAIINDVLDFSKIEAGKMTLEQVPFSITGVINSSVSIFGAEAARKQLAFVTDIDPDVPPLVLGDPVRLQQVLNNLLSNAVKFTDAGEVRLTVHREAGNRLTFAVADTGVGIDPATQGRLFAAFQQADQSTTRRYGGTGLGLAISRQLIQLMNGSISFESDLGRGTTFYFTIPLVVADGDSAVPAPAEPAPRRHSGRLLVVDDNLINQQVAAGLLRKLGHEVDTAGDGGQAVQQRFAADYDAILMDCEMPVLDGYAATRAIRERERRDGLPAVPVVALTAHAFPEQIQACHRAGMDDHLAKPINLRALEQVLSRVLAERSNVPINDA
jgi:signal transduction histidine kinase/CheY-like chemotaxis protein